ncbi:MAG: 16S rRNA (uracil(1498)-N(3))-methyltransferase [Gemmatimonadetes bacterium]|nr:16S rRNA (uracil(1498)-N(3))-methyltransferase [Gemmatimonadota bacterium]
MDRVFVPAEAFTDGRAVISGPERHHLADVLRVHPGERFLATDGCGREYLLQAEAVTRREIEAAIVETRDVAADGPQVSLAIAPPRGSRMDFAVEKSVECGVARIVPLRAERSVLKGKKDSARAERWLRLARSAVAQSGRVHVPEIAPVVRVGEALTDAAARGRVLIAHPGPEAVSIPEALSAPEALSVSGTPGKPESVTVFIGPEGGFTDAELEEGRRIGATRVSLGPTRLRTETAAIVAVTLALAAGTAPRG